MRKLIENRKVRRAGVAATAATVAGLGALAVSAWSDPTSTAAATRDVGVLKDAMTVRLLARTKWTGPSVGPALELSVLSPTDPDVAPDSVLTTAAQPFFIQASSSAERKRAERCLATAIYYEAALEPEQGQRAVAQVVLNRVRDPNFPKSVCGVVYQGWERTTGCQFSFTCDGSLARVRIPLIYARAEDYARDALDGRVVPEVGTATHYHTDYVSPYWGPTLIKITQVGAHIFYRWPGAPGLPGAFTGRYRGGELALSEAVLTGRAARPAPSPTELLTDTLLVRTVVAADPNAPGALTERVRGVLTPGGRRAPTAADIAQINARLQSFEAGQGTAPPASGIPALPPLEPAVLELKPVGEPPAAAAVEVVEVNRPAPKPAEE